MAAIDNIAVIQATLAPVFLLSGAAIYLNFVQARLFRVLDRIEAAEKEDVPMRRNDPRRLTLLRNSVLFGVLVMMLTILTAVVLLVPSAFPGNPVGRWPIWLFGLSLFTFALGLACAVGDAFLSVRRAERHVAAVQAREHEVES